MKYSIKAFIRRIEGYYEAECVELDASARGRSLDETVENLRAAVGRCLDGADMNALGLDPDSTLFITLEDVPLMPANAGCRCRNGGFSQ